MRRRKDPWRWRGRSRRGRMSKLVATVVAIGLGLAMAVGAAWVAPVLIVAAQGGTPAATPVGEPPPLPGQVAEAEREFSVRGTRPGGALAFRFGVAEFASLETAIAALPVVVDRIAAEQTMADLEQGTVGRIGDETLLFEGPVPGSGVVLDTAILLVRDGRYVHLWIGAALDADPVPDLLAVADRVLPDSSAAGGTPGATPAGTPNGAPNPEALLDRLPTINDLPEGFVMSSEGSELENVEASGTPAA